VTLPVWGKKNEERSVERVRTPPLCRFSDFEGKAAILNCGRNIIIPSLYLSPAKNYTDFIGIFFSIFATCS
jgi:hypothetical protein